MRDSSYLWGSPIKRSTRIAGVLVAIVMCVAMALLLAYATDLNTEIQHANQRADIERQCAKALEAWVHQQVVPSEQANAETQKHLESLDQVKSKACRARLNN
jgi:predicted PurR-regulated permease PerM